MNIHKRSRSAYCYVLHSYMQTAFSFVTTSLLFTRNRCKHVIYFISPQHELQIPYNSASTRRGCKKPVLWLDRNSIGISFMHKVMWDTAKLPDKEDGINRGSAFHNVMISPCCHSLRVIISRPAHTYRVLLQISCRCFYRKLKRRISGFS